MDGPKVLGIADVTAAAEIEPRVKVVELSRMKDRAGNPVRVLCEPIRELDLLAITKTLPAEAPELGPAEDAATTEAVSEALDRLDGMAHVEQVIEKGTALRGPGGTWIRPAFSSAEPLPAGSYSMRWLSDIDKLLLLEGVLDVTGVPKEVLEKLSFRHEDRGGVDPGAAGVGDVETRAESDPIRPGGDPESAAAGDELDRGDDSAHSAGASAP